MRFLFVTLILLSNLISTNLEHPKIYKNQKINNWLMSEKLDGIRAYFDGKNLLTKNGNIINTPKDFLKNFPPFALDGELWTKRADFENIQSIVLDNNPSKKWQEITYNIFEVPFEDGNFLQRLEKAKNWFAKNKNENIRFIKQIPCKNDVALNDYLEQIVNLKGEGVIIKNPNNPYLNKRNKNILKVKKFYDDEGEVIAINYRDKTMKSLVLKLKNGVTFNLGGGFTKAQRLNHPKVGDIITFKYYGLTKNQKPKFASFLRIRDKNTMTK